MRVVEYRSLTQASGMLTGMDGFAALGGALTAEPTIGGFRIVRPRQTQHALIRLRTLRQMTGTRLHASGTMSALLVGALTLAILAGPASNPDHQQSGKAPPIAAASDTRALARFVYTRASDIGLPPQKRQPPALDTTAPGADGALPKLAALVEPYGDTVTASVSPISTAAITPGDDARNSFTGRVRLGALLPKTEALADAPPKPLRLAAAGPTDDAMIPTLPMVEIETPDAPAAATVETEPQAVRDTPTAREHTISAHHSRAARNARRARGSVDPAIVAAKKYARAPRWAQQMFENPWQSKAFSYIQ